jgi:hypothetical protein
MFLSPNLDCCCRQQEQGVHSSGSTDLIFRHCVSNLAMVLFTVTLQTQQHTGDTYSHILSAAGEHVRIAISKFWEASLVSRNVSQLHYLAVCQVLALQTAKNATV